MYDLRCMIFQIYEKYSDHEKCRGLTNRTDQKAPIMMR